MNDVARGQAISGCDLGVARRTAAKLAAFGEKVTSRGATDCAVHAAAAKKRRIGGVYDGIDIELRVDDDFEHGIGTACRKRLARERPCFVRNLRIRKLRNNYRRCAVATSIEKMRELLMQPPTEDTARALKEWRAHKCLSQTEAAIRLGVPVRTLQGWELGRPMPYPRFLQRAANIAARPEDLYSVVQSDFPREFAEFIDFVGGRALDNSIQKIDKKLRALSPGARSIFGDRYFFQEQCVRFTCSSSPFQLNISDPFAVRAASLMASINRVKRSLSQKGVERLHKMVIDNLKSDRDIRQIEHEFRCSTHFGQKDFKVRFGELEGLGRFDLLVETPSVSIEVECKTVSVDTGSQIKLELAANLSEALHKAVLNRPPVDESGIFTLTLNKPAADCKHLARQLEDALQSETAQSFLAADFSLVFSPRPQWQELLSSERGVDSNTDEYRCIMKAGGKIVVLDIRPHKSTMLPQRLVGTIKKGADQCTGKKQSVIWLHFVGVPEAEFESLAEFSIGRNGAGLDAIVAKAVHPSASSTDRTHVHSVRFSTDSHDLGNHLVLAANLLMVRAVSSGGPCYDVHNPFCRFPKIANL